MAQQTKLIGQRCEPPAPTDYTLERHRGRQLSPIKAPRLNRPPEPTSYMVHRLILSGNHDAQEAAKTAIENATPGIKLEKLPCHLFELTGHGGEVLDIGDDHGAVHRITTDGKNRHVVLPDAWAVLEAARAKDPEAVAGVSLDHLMFGPSVGGTAPYTSGHGTGGTAPYTSGHGTGDLALASYGMAGSGGRQVVNWVGAKPKRDKDLAPEQRPVVAIFDTGCGKHKWLKRKEGVTRLTVSGADEVNDFASYQDQDSPLLGELDSHSGHGTFVAGIIRQNCPDADLMSIRVMSSDGVVKEWEALHALQVLAIRMQKWVNQEPEGARVDVVVLSLGYYVESANDEYYTSQLGDVLRQLGKLGVVVIAASGTDATTRKFFPAAFSPVSDEVIGNEATGVPVIAVGSLNPDERSIALFNNSGDWIRCWEPGVSLVSSVPANMVGSLQPRVRLPKRQGNEPYKRSSIDDDNFTSGFAVWSGTSFSAPVLAAKIARALLEGGRLAERGDGAAHLRGWAAVERATDIRLVPPVGESGVAAAAVE